VNTAIVQTVVQDSSSPKRYTVRMLHTSSSLKEEVIRPVRNDLVLLLFLRGHKDEMFNDPNEREAGEEKDPTIYAEDADNYTMFSGVGILMSTAKGRAYSTVTYDEDSDGATVNERVFARVTKEFNKAMAVLFDVPIDSDGASASNADIDISFGKRSPLNVEHHAAVTKKFGYDEDADGNIVNLDAPVTETYSVTAPITKNIQGAVTNTIGTDAEGAATDAPVTIDLNEKSPVTVTSKEGATASFDKAVSLTSKEGLSLTFDKAVLIKTSQGYTLEATGAVEIKGATITLNTGDAATWMPNCVAACPFGFPHGGASGGIVKLTGK